MTDGPATTLPGDSPEAWHAIADLVSDLIAQENEESGEPRQTQLEQLIEASRAADDQSRSWAAYGLANLLSTFDESIMEALYERLNDCHDETRGEALLGLARRSDPAVVEPLVRELKSDTVGTLAVEAAAWIASGALCEPLTALREWWDVDEALLEEAISRCCYDGPQIFHSRLRRWMTDGH